MAEEESKKGKSKLKGCLTVVLGIFLLLVIIGIFAGGDDKNPSGSSPASDTASLEPETPPVEVSAQQLFSAYDSNEARAQQMYGGKRLLITGTVAAVDLGIGDKPNVQLVTSNQFMPVTLNNTDDISSKAANLDKGQQITALCGDVHEVMGRPFLDDCVLQ